MAIDQKETEEAEFDDSGYFDREAKEALRLQKEEADSHLLRTEVDKWGATYTVCEKHGRRANNETVCSLCDYQRSQNCEVCGKEKTSPLYVPSAKNIHVDEHKDCAKPTGGFWMEKTVCSIGNNGDECNLPTCDTCSKKYS